MMNRRHLLTASVAGLAFSATGLVAHGVAQPGGKIARMLVGFPAGGNTDFVARLLANELKGYSSTIKGYSRRSSSRTGLAEPAASRSTV